MTWKSKWGGSGVGHVISGQVMTVVKWCGGGSGDFGTSGEGLNWIGGALKMNVKKGWPIIFKE